MEALTKSLHYSKSQPSEHSGASSIVDWSQPVDHLIAISQHDSLGLAHGVRGESASY
jgi:hypothetical protein